MVLITSNGTITAGYVFLRLFHQRRSNDWTTDPAVVTLTYVLCVPVALGSILAAVVFSNMMTLLLCT